jgi:hypothetical protein
MGWSLKYHKIDGIKVWSKKLKNNCHGTYIWSESKWIRDIKKKSLRYSKYIQQKKY